MKGRLPYRNLSIDVISKIIELSEKGYGITTISKKLKISPKTAHEYVTKFLDK